MNDFIKSFANSGFGSYKNLDTIQTYLERGIIMTNKLNDKDLAQVAGGRRAEADDFDLKRNEFETAWTSLNMEKEGYSGMRKAEMFDEWESTGYKTDAKSFILSNK